jgi:hypothetical protein
MNIARAFLGIFLAAAFSQTSDSPPIIKVLVLDALNGKPQAGARVDFLCNEIPHRTDTFATTNASGIAEVPYECKSGNKIEMGAEGADQKEGCGSGVSVTMDEVRATGVIAVPGSVGIGGIWCPDKIRRKLKPVPGQVILFVKKPTWYQSHVAG